MTLKIGTILKFDLSSLIFRDETVNLLQNDYEYLKKFLSANISDPQIVNLLNKSPTIEQIPEVIDLLKYGEKNRSYSSGMETKYFSN